MRLVQTPIIESDEDLGLALARLNEIFDAPKGAPEADEAEALAIMIESYERRTLPEFPSNPVAAIRFAMEQRGYGYADLARVIGSAARGRRSRGAGNYDRELRT